MEVCGVSRPSCGRHTAAACHNSAPQRPPRRQNALLHKKWFGRGVSLVAAMAGERQGAGRIVYGKVPPKGWNSRLEGANCTCLTRFVRHTEPAAEDADRLHSQSGRGVPWTTPWPSKRQAA